jgi:hypothetical protein
MDAMEIVVGRVGLSVDREERGTHSPSLLLASVLSRDRKLSVGKSGLYLV